MPRTPRVTLVDEFRHTDGCTYRRYRLDGTSKCTDIKIRIPAGDALQRQAGRGRGRPQAGKPEMGSPAPGPAMIGQTARALPPVAVTAGATWLLHKRAGLPFWQALVAVLLGLAFGPDGPGDQLAVFAAQATRRIAAKTAPAGHRSRAAGKHAAPRPGPCSP